MKDIVYFGRKKFLQTWRNTSPVERHKI